MMYNEIVEKLRSVINDGTGVTNELAEILYRHKCFGALMDLESQDTKWKLLVSQKLLIHQKSLKERLNCCRHIWPALTEQKIPYAVIKGSVLSLMAYSHPNRRISNDLDILIRYEDTKRIKDLFYSLGFVQGRISDTGIVPYSRKEQLFYTTTSHQMAPFQCMTTNPKCLAVSVDVNFDIFWGENTQNIDMNLVLSEVERCKLYGHLINKLKPEMEFIALCLHQYKDLNSITMLYNKGIQLSLFFDIYYYWKNVSLNIDNMYQLSKMLCAIPYVYYCLFYTAYIFDDDTMKSILSLFYTERGKWLLTRYGLHPDEVKEWDLDFLSRLFCEDLTLYLENHMIEKDWKKLQENHKNL